MIIANNFILPHARNTLSCSQIQYVIDQLRKTTGWKMVVKQLSKEGRHLKSRAAPDIASASNGLTDSSYCSTCLSTSLTITSLSPLVLVSFQSIDEQLPGAALALAWSAKTSSLFKVLAFPFPAAAAALLRPFPKMHLHNFFSKTLFPVKLCRQVNCKILNLVCFLRHFLAKKNIKLLFLEHNMFRHLALQG